MKKLFLLITLFISFSSFSQVLFPGGIDAIAGLAVRAPKPGDDRTVVADSTKLPGIHDTFKGLIATDISTEPPTVYVRGNSLSAWYKLNNTTQTFNQNNIGKVITLNVSSNGTDAAPTTAQVAESLNRRSRTVSQYESPVIIKFNYLGSPPQTYLYLFTGGKGTYGLTGTQIVESQLLFLTSQATTPADIAGDSNTQTISLGTISTDNYLTAANSQARDLSNADVVYFFSYTKDSILYLVQFINPVRGMYGAGGITLQASDFSPSTNSSVRITIDPTPTVNSNNAVSSNGTAVALANKEPRLSGTGFVMKTGATTSYVPAATTVAAGNSAPVTSEAVKTALDTKADKQVVEKGRIITENFTTPGNFTLGLNATITGGALNFTGGTNGYITPADVANYDFYGYTKLGRYTAKFNLTAPTVATAGAGLSFGTSGGRNVYVKFCLETAKRGYMEIYLGSTLFETSPGFLNIPANDVTTCIVTRDSDTWFVTWKTSAGKSISHAFRVEAGFQSGAQPNYGRFSFVTNGGTVAVTNWTVDSGHFQNAEIALITDSTGYVSVINSAQSWPFLLKEKFVQTFNAYIGPSDKWEENNLKEVVDHNPKIIILSCMSNNTVASYDTPTSLVDKMQASLDYLATFGYDYNDANGDGKGVYLTNIMPRLDVDVRPYNTAIETKWTNTINIFDPFVQAGLSILRVGVSGDGIHLNPLVRAQKLYADIIGVFGVNNGFLRYRPNQKPFVNVATLDANDNLFLGQHTVQAATKRLQLANGDAIGSAYTNSNGNGWEILSNGSATGTLAIVNGGTFNGTRVTPGQNGVSSGLFFTQSGISLWLTSTGVAGTPYNASRDVAVWDPTTGALTTTLAMRQNTVTASLSPGAAVSMLNSANTLGDLLTLGTNANLTALPANGAKGYRLVFINDNTSIYDWTCTATNAKNLDGTPFTVFPKLFKVVEFVSNGTNWICTATGDSYTVSTTLDFPSTAPNNNNLLTVTVAGATVGDIVVLGVPDTSVTTNHNYGARVTAANTVTIRFNNNDPTLTINPASGIFKVKIIK